MFQQTMIAIGGLEMTALEACRLAEVVGQDQTIAITLSTHQKIAIQVKIFKNLVAFIF